jgi:hypothetical protein
MGGTARVQGPPGKAQCPPQAVIADAAEIKRTVRKLALNGLRGSLRRVGIARRTFLASLPPHVCSNEVMITPTWNRGYVAELESGV